MKERNLRWPRSPRKTWISRSPRRCVNSFQTGNCPSNSPEYPGSRIVTRMGEIACKVDLHGHLISLREAAVYNIFAQTCLHEFIKKWQRGEADPTSIKTELPEGTIDLNQYMQRLAKHGDQAPVETKRNANRSITRNLLKEGFRITQSFYQATGAEVEMTGQAWYQFTRIVVNSLSHDFRFQFHPHDLRQLPVTFDGQTIDASQNGQPATMPLRTLLALYDEIIRFVATDLRGNNQG